MRKERKHFTPEEKVAILRRHLVDKVPVSELCEELGLRPTMFYRWQKELFENGAAAFQSQGRPHRQVEEKQKRIEFLEKTIWVPHDVRDLVVEFVRCWSEKAEIGVGRFIPWLGVTASKFYDWRQRYGCVNEHNGWVPRDFWLEPWEKEAIIEFHLKNPLEGYRRLTFMMLDADVVAVSSASVWRVLKQAGLLSRWKSKPSRKGTGFEQPLQPHQHWHIDISYINLSGTFYYLCSILDGFSRFLVHWDLRESMRETDVEVILQRAKENYLEAKPRIISDNGPQFIARDFKEFIRISGMTHVRTSPYYPQSNGKIERWHKSLKGECIRPGTPLSLEDARRLVEGYVEHYNNVRLNSAIGYITPKDMLAGHQQEIQAERDRKLDAAKEQRKNRRQGAA